MFNLKLHNVIQNISQGKKKITQNYKDFNEKGVKTEKKTCHKQVMFLLPDATFSSSGHLFPLPIILLQYLHFLLCLFTDDKQVVMWSGQ